MKSKMKLIAGPTRVSARLLTAEEIQDYELDELKPPLIFGLVTSIGWNYLHTRKGLIIIFDLNNAVKIFSDTYVIEERMILAKIIKLKENQDPFLTGSGLNPTSSGCHPYSSRSEPPASDDFF